MKPFYTDDDDIEGYWDERHRAFPTSAEWSWLYESHVLAGKVDWWMEVFAPHVRPYTRTVLDVGCGIGLYSPAVLRVAEQYWGLDPSQAAIDYALVHYAHPGTCWWVGSAVDMPFGDRMFDLAFTVTVLQHLPLGRRQAAVAEMKRVLAPTGHALMYEDIKTDGPYDIPPCTVAEWEAMWQPWTLRRLDSYLWEAVCNR